MCSGLVHDPQAFVRISLKSGVVNSKTEAMFPTLYESKEITLARAGRIPAKPSMNSP